MIWIVIASGLSLYVAWNLGANDVANSMGTSVGSGAVSLRQALAIAGVLEFFGAVLFGRRVVGTLASGVVNPNQFTDTPQVLLLGMVSVLMTCGLWLNLATRLGLPVASSHAVVGAIAGFGWAASGLHSVNGSLLGQISLTWLVTPLVSGAIAAGFYTVLRRGVLQSPQPLQQIYEWLPWLSLGLVSGFGLIVLPVLQPVISAQISGQISAQIHLPPHTLALIIGAIATLGISAIAARPVALPDSPNPTGEDREATAAKLANPIEQIMARFQLVSACFVAFAHGSNDVGNAIAPLATIVYLTQPAGDETALPLWILVLGALGIVGGLAVWGGRVITTIGEGILALQPSSGLCAELATAATVLIASRVGLPVSTSHALVGAVVGVGLSQRSSPIHWSMVRQISLAWVGTIPLCGGLAAAIFWGLICLTH
ncbi:inorganic phosphate transporter [Leptolyngbya sp. O-77]|uniref:inorganic phosphate transporter n=1 Tax=Leptolyngbya sp. O-77 TaxID=1080068 RepID=UPI00074D4BF6|nr:inorganic phosphate transporter [Leptolyngbya sp. O-77]BAU42116.1 Low-affinity inorganic phosphate transporter 1 [Leptolyngbya sp. O-77]